jgi:hypothetical protein
MRSRVESEGGRGVVVLVPTLRFPAWRQTNRAST